MVTLTHFLEGNPLSPHRLLFLDKQQGIFYMHFSIDRTVHTTAFDKPVVVKITKTTCVKCTTALMSTKCFILLVCHHVSSKYDGIAVKV